MFLLCALAASEEYTGTQSKYLDIYATQDILIQDCQFTGLGGWAVYHPAVRIQQGTPAFSTTITETTFTNCQATWAGGFSFEASTNFKVMKTVVDSCKSGSSYDYGCIAYIKPTSDIVYTLTLNSFINCPGGSKPLDCFGYGKLSNLNFTNDWASAGIKGAANGVLAYDTATKIDTSYTNFYKCYSTCGILYAYYITDTCTISNSNFIENTVAKWYLVGTEGSKKSLKVDSCIFKDNIYSGHEIFGVYSGVQMIVVNCKLDSTTMAGTISQDGNTVTSATEIPIVFYATGVVEAKIPYGQPSNGQASSPGTGPTAAVPVIPGDLPTEDPDGTASKGNEDTGDIPVETEDASNTNSSHVANADSGKGGKSTGKSTPMWLLAVIAGAVVVAALIVGFVASKFYEKRLDESDSQYSNQESEDTEHIEIPPQQPEEQHDEEPVDPDLNQPDLTSMELTPNLTSRELNGAPENDNEENDDE